uniref:Uncharacterized protein n=1 Tax=Kalanchoe fedtschenkoi TaxID=63787 RepID=A0A7N0U141_KALFE
MVAMESYLNVKNAANRIVNGHSNILNNYGISELGTLQNSQFLGSPGHVLDSGFAVDWSIDEQHILDEGLIKFANEPPVMKYVKISGLLMDKTARDVAMRCNWMKKKRRKQNEPNAEKKTTTRKEIPSKDNLCSAPPLNMAPYSHSTHNMVPTKLAHEAYQGPFQNLLQENAELFSRIDGNFSALKENLDLFRHTRNNIITLLNNMTDLRGTLSPMPPLPVSINEDLVNTVLQDMTQARMFGFPNGSF